MAAAGGERALCGVCCNVLVSAWPHTRWVIVWHLCLIHEETGLKTGAEARRQLFYRDEVGGGPWWGDGHEARWQFGASVLG